MERLTERDFYNGKHHVSVDSKQYGISCSNFCTSCGKADCDDIRKALFKLAEYEDLEEQGKLLRLPVCVGDTLYFPCIDDVVKEKVISEEEVTEIGLYYRVGNGELSSCKEIGDIIFLTQEQAELALKEMEGEK